MLTQLVMVNEYWPTVVGIWGGIAMDTDVLIVGAGPTGLTLAGDLARAGVRHMVLERRSTEPNTTRAFAVHARTLEQLDVRGVADELVATGRRVPGIRLYGLAEVSLSSVPSRFPFVLVTPQYETERVLAGRGVEVISGVAVASVDQDVDSVTATLTDWSYAAGSLSGRL